VAAFGATIVSASKASNSGYFGTYNILVNSLMLLHDSQVPLYHGVRPISLTSP
jgi:hypothetical protein